ncbi:PorP/SprF family type IX secretion system membrane protein [Ulvibacter litoralis]|uniref:Type IX secretion system membrane protein, PorP/SprF family n=1 Tax=Ulvibacter litoralis TaxID=227084 RepID=A0A1G7FN82_9FLAO|nr:type IX secretion system membrane protein PorP/SprF [Ulvibacter litoralis]GHC50455.1 membrane protein [Ulvibacter litoralis]SDE77333.1 type IX secretion system membrane protein, PorP/SprF family [Ulvibacter litoralis]
MKQFNIYNRTIITLSFLLCTFLGYSQQDPQFTQYMYNMSVINPGYATSELGMVNIGGLYRSQWVGLEGAPRTGTFFAHTPLSEKVEAGISFTNDNIGDIVTENNIYADVAYVLQVSKNSKLSLGVKAGVTLFNANFNDFQLQSGDTSTDIAFNDNINKAFPNIGAGAFYFTDRFYAGVSAPNLLTSTHLENENGVSSTGVQDIHFFLTSGYVFDISEDVKLKPAFMLKGVKGAPFSMDLTANVLIQKRVEAGIGYRLDDSFSGLVNFRVTPQLRVGYAYDMTTSNLSDYNSGSHEIMVLFDFDLFNLQRGYDRSPRFF